MATRKQNSSINKERILLASIPVVGSIIIAFFATDRFNSKTEPEKDEPKVELVALKAKAGNINEMIVFRRYNDLSELMIDGLKPIITREIFYSVADSVAHSLGDFIKPIDTTYSNISDNNVFFVKNQYQRGMNVNQIIFDKQGKITGLFSSPIPD